MKNKDKKLSRKIRLGFILGVALILFSAQLIVSVIEIALIDNNVIPESWRTNQMVFLSCIWGIVCIFLGCIITVIVSYFVLKPMNELLDSIMQLAAGDYTVRANIRKGSAIKIVSESVNHLAEELEKTEILRSDFVNNFSHEFKTPINSINGFIKLLKKDNLSRKKQIEYLNIIEEETDRLLDITTNILSLSKLENQAVVSKERVNISEQIRTSILLLDRKWNNKSLHFNLDFDEFYVYANEEMLKEVWINLLDNAIKFSDFDGSISVRIYDSNLKVFVEIENTGSEIKDEDKERIFQKFYQGDQSHCKSGNGIGLSIVKRIVDMHDGSIIVNSKNGITCFTISLPKYN